ncbi:MAG: winged helix-turn-helix transcriptional regulator [bacterium]|nr:winged helix-turn-helix transcriptional regulator [bacterium]
MDKTGAVPRYSTLEPGADLKRAVTEAHRLLDDLLAADMAALGLSTGEADLLTVVRIADRVVVPGDVAAWLGLTGAGVTGRLNTLERRDLIERRPNPADGRSVTIHLTPAGERLADEVLTAKDSTVVNEIVESLGQDTAAQLVRHLDAITAAARAALSQ